MHISFYDSLESVCVELVIALLAVTALYLLVLLCIIVALASTQATITSCWNALFILLYMDYAFFFQ